MINLDCEAGACTATAELDCNDENPCTNDGCIGLDVIDCDDDNPCTNDSCNALAGCVYTPVLPCCGNGVIEPGELCDDGNTKDGDECSSICTLAPPSSCKALHEGSPSLPSGTYVIDADGAGPAAPFTVYCDMVNDGGG